MHQKLEQDYKPLVDFLAKTLGDKTEIVLQDVTDESNSIVYIANSEISGRNVGAPLTNLALQMISSGEWKEKDYVSDYYGTSVTGKLLKSSTFFIKDEGELIGMLCINCDVSAYKEASDRLLQLAGITAGAVMPVTIDDGEKKTIERFSDSVADVTRTVLEEVCKDIPIDRLTQTEKLEIIKALNDRGVFLLKGAVSDVAAVLCCSDASVYRYLSKVSKGA